METRVALRFRSPSPEATHAVARALASVLEEGGLVIALRGPLGAGKTAFVKGLAEGLGLDPGVVCSPTFVISAEYPACEGGVRLVHLDLYRLESAGELEAAGFLDVLDEHSVVAIEWADRIASALPGRASGDRPVVGNGGRRDQRPGDPRRGPGSRGRVAAAALAALSRHLGDGRGGERGMSLIVQKFGGTSVGDVERIQNVARRVVATKQAGHRVAVVVSAMAGETDGLVKLAQAAGGDEPDPREYDALVSTGEQKTIALLAMAIQRLGQKARSFTGAQIGLKTDTAHTRARIQSIDAARILEVLDDDTVAVIAGFQGIDDDGNITTLGRGGSDTSAVAVAAALHADVCEIYTDVDGVYTTDPNMVPAARKLARISFDEMLEMASLGAKVLQIRSVKFAMQYGVPIHVRSSFTDHEGTWVVREEDAMEGLVVSGVTYNRNEAKIRLRGVKDQPGVAARLFGALGEAGIVVDMIVQNVGQDGSTDMTFTVPRVDYRRAFGIAETAGKEIGATGVVGDDTIAKVSIVGLGMKDHAGVASRMFQILAHERINIQLISTSEIKISVLIEEKYTELAVRALHAAFVEAGAAEPRAES